MTPTLQNAKVFQNGRNMTFLTPSLKFLAKLLSPIHATIKPEYEVEDLESIWVEVKHTHFKCVVNTTYRPPNSSGEYWGKLEESIEKAKNDNNNNMFILGDLNCDQMVQNSRLARILENYNFTQFIKGPTRVTDKSQTCLDIIATTCPDYVESSGILTPSMSDHSPVYACLQLQKPKGKCYKREVWQTDNVDWDTLNTNLQNLDWSPVYNSADINDIVTKWTNMYKNELRKVIPNKTITVRDNEPTWMTPEIRRLIRKRKRIHNKAKKKNTEEQWQNFRTMRNLVIQKIREAKESHVMKQMNYINNEKNPNPKTWWNLVKSYYKEKYTTTRSLQTT